MALGCFHYSKPAARCTPPCLCLYSANVSLCRPGLMFPSFPLSLLVPPLFHHASFSFLFILSPFNAPFFTSALNPALARLSFESRSPSHTHHSLSLSQARQLFVSPARFSGHSNQQSKKESKKRQESSQIEQATAISGNRNQGRFRPHSTALAKPAPTGLDPNHFPLSFSSHCSNWSQRCIASRSSPSLVHKRSKKKKRETPFTGRCLTHGAHHHAAPASQGPLFDVVASTPFSAVVKKGRLKGKILSSRPYLP